MVVTNKNSNSTTLYMILQEPQYGIARSIESKKSDDENLSQS